jgi:hypothetical protein
LTFDDVKRTIIDLVVSEKWYRQGAQNKEEFLKEFQAAADMPELMRKLSAYGQVQF